MATMIQKSSLPANRKSVSQPLTANNHESLNNLTPADVYFGRGQAILLERERIKRLTIANRRLQHHVHAA